MDAWCQHTGQPFDAYGAWAKSGQRLPAAPFLASLLDDPTCAANSKHGGSFSPRLAEDPVFAGTALEDTQNTLTELTVRVCAMQR
jgi:anhydro-N-acetylmuramic acid kinase